ncbi:MAG: T9SS type A sorting domain-containing protein [Flavobacteriales bacterium]|nr:T9SS type A sorting domain-containing protein [Flavobacteriales bacterium]
MRSLLWIVLALTLPIAGHGQIHVDVDAANVIGVVNPLWGDHYDVQLLFGAGGNPTVSGPKELYIDDPEFGPLMNDLKPRSIRVSTGRYDDPPSADFYSSDTAVLRNLWTEWYRGPNTIAGVNDLSNFDFTYVDSLVDVVQAIGAEPYVEFAAMPFDLSSVQTPTYFGCVGWPVPCHIFSWDNAIRTAPPADNAVYGRAVYQLIKHLYTTRNVTWFEAWNEPDQFPGLSPFWDGDAIQLHAMYAAIVAEVEADPLLSPNIKLGCCSFAMQSFLNLFPVQFLSTVQQAGTRMDFLSFHPYANVGGGYDPAKTEIARTWRDTYVPDAELVNGEWGMLDPGFGSAGWNSLDYGLDRIKAIIAMQDAEITFAHAASLSDNDTTAATCCLGMFYAKPTFSAKPAAFAYMAMNRILGATERLHAQVDTPYTALACSTLDQDTLYVVVPADDPDGSTGNITVSINNLPWSTGTATRFELTMSDYANGDVLVPTASQLIGSNSFQDSLTYQSDQGNGRLVIWELVQVDDLGIANAQHSPIRVHPNPTTQAVTIDAPFTISPRDVWITDELGRPVAVSTTAVSHGRIRIDLPRSGVYSIRITGHEQFPVRVVVLK